MKVSDSTQCLKVKQFSSFYTLLDLQNTKTSLESRRLLCSSCCVSVTIFHCLIEKGVNFQHSTDRRLVEVESNNCMRAKWLLRPPNFTFLNTYFCGMVKKRGCEKNGIPHAKIDLLILITRKPPWYKTHNSIFPMGRRAPSNKVYPSKMCCGAEEVINELLSLI